MGIYKVGIDKVGINPCNHGESLQRVCTATDGMLFWFCLLWFAASASSGSFQTLFSRLTSWQLVRFLIYLKDKLVLQAQPFLVLLQDQWHIWYKYWKQSALWNWKGLACETKKRVFKYKQKQMLPSSNKDELMIKKNLNRWQVHGLGRKNLPMKQRFYYNRGRVLHPWDISIFLMNS